MCLSANAFFYHPSFSLSVHLFVYLSSSPICLSVHLSTHPLVKHPNNPPPPQSGRETEARGPQLFDELPLAFQAELSLESYKTVIEKVTTPPHSCGALHTPVSCGMFFSPASFTSLCCAWIHMLLSLFSYPPFFPLA